jgi:hypothetical protein
VGVYAALKRRSSTVVRAIKIFNTEGTGEHRVRREKLE